LEAAGQFGAYEVGAPLSDRVYDWLRDAVIRGAIRPNQRLVEVDLAAELQVSRTPVRDALRRLEAEGLVATRRREWIVRDHSREDISEIYELRMGLEALTSRLASRKGSDVELDSIVRIAESHPLHQAESVPADAWVTSNNDFHHAIAHAAHNTRLFEALRVNKEHYFNYRVARLYSAGELQESFAEHAGIAAALQARDADLAAAIMERHVTKALETLLAKL
jgi:DNA-binding GntR family transcriptional regulator